MGTVCDCPFFLITTPGYSDKMFVSRFLDDANEVFEAASAVSEASAGLTILIHAQGQIHIVDGSDAPLESLQAEHGCGTAYRVTRNAGAVRVEGRSGSNRCILEKSKPAAKTFSAAAALGVFCDRPLYSVAGRLAIA